MLIDAGFGAKPAGHALALMTAIVHDCVRVHRCSHVPRLAGPSRWDRLPADEFPRIVRSVVIDDPDWEEKQFRYNLRCALAGIASELNGSDLRAMMEYRL